VGIERIETIRQSVEEKNLEEARCIVCSTTLEQYIPVISDDRYGCPGIYSIARCSACGQMATLPPLRESDLPDLYSRYYPRREMDLASLSKEADKVRAPLAGFRRWLAGTDNQGHYRARPGQTVLDIGSGSCLALLEMRAMGVEAYGVEADPNVRSISGHFGLSVHIGSIHDHPFPGVMFDLIVLNQVIEHVPDPLALLSLVKGRLKPGGRVVLSFPNTTSMQAAHSGVRWINWHVPYHQHHFNRRSFEKLAVRAGYEPVTARTITPNLWTVLQLRVNRETPAEGLASATWSSQATGANARPPFHALLKRKLISLGARVATVPVAFFNRTYDALGKGDSLLVELRLANRERG
jgi:SAM-dependent methyltransferase